MARLGSAAALGAVIVAALAVVAQDGARSVRDGVYTAEQAVRGERLFETICANCHEVAEFTAADAYLDDVDGTPLWETFDYISSEMPEDDPGSLDPEEYADALAYIFSIYGLPKGEQALPVDRRALEAITVTRPAPPGS